MIQNNNTFVINADSLKNINPNSDTSLLLGKYADKKGLKVFWYEPKNLNIVNNKLVAIGNYITFKDDKHFIDSTQKPLSLNDAICVIVRQNPPVDINYLENTYMLDLLEGITPVLNPPVALRNFNEKFVMFKEFQHLMPKTITTSNVDYIIEFLNVHKKIVLKPTYLFGGSGIISISYQQKNLKEKIQNHIKKYGMLFVQEYLEDIKYGDKRIYLVNYKPISLINRMPIQGGFISNTAAGGAATVSTLSDSDIEICKKIKPFLQKNKIYFAGIDVIGKYLNEINFIYKNDR